MSEPPFLPDLLQAEGHREKKKKEKPKTKRRPIPFWMTLNFSSVSGQIALNLSAGRPPLVPPHLRESFIGRRLSWHAVGLCGPLGLSGGLHSPSAIKLESSEVNQMPPGGPEDNGPVHINYNSRATPCDRQAVTYNYCLQPMMRFHVVGDGSARRKKNRIGFMQMSEAPTRVRTSHRQWGRKSSYLRKAALFSD